jgi:hypothetical protein
VSAAASELPVVVDPAPIADLLSEVADLHHRYYRITDGDDPDWATWYATWLVELSELPRLLGRPPVRSELVHVFVVAARDAPTEAPDQPWQQFYARRIAERFAA